MTDTVELDIAIRSSNAAFGDDPMTAAAETARILRDIANDIAFGTSHCSGNVRDINGNTIGSFVYNYTPEEDEDND